MKANITLHKLDHATEKDIYTTIYSDLHFAKMRKSYIVHLLKKYPTLTPKQIKSLRNEYIKDTVVTRYHTVRPAIIAEKYTHTPISKLSKKYKLPPIILLKQVYAHNKHTSTAIAAILDRRTPLQKYDADQLEDALKHDSYTLVDNKTQLEMATKFEHKIGTILTANNITYKTQETLACEQMKEFKRAVSTPDFLLSASLHINNIKINWIDAKNYYLACVPFTKKSIKKQIQKYIDAYGTGAIVAKYGACDALQLDNTIIIPYNDFKACFAKTHAT